MMESLVRYKDKIPQFTDTGWQKAIFRASAEYFQKRYKTPQELITDFKERRLQPPGYATAYRWLNGEATPSLPRSCSIVAAGLTDYLHTLNQYTQMAFDDALREKQRFALEARHRRERYELEQAFKALEEVDRTSRGRTGVARGVDAQDTVYQCEMGCAEFSGGQHVADPEARCNSCVGE